MAARNPSTRRTPRWRRRLTVALRRLNIFPILEIASLAALVAMIVTSWLAFSGHGGEPALVPATQAGALLVGTLVPAMALLVCFGRRVALARAGGGTARLHVRLVFFFSLVAAVPTLLVAAFAAFLFQSGLAFWNSEGSRGLLADANAFARGYYEQTEQDLSAETQAMAGDLRFLLARRPTTSREFEENFSYQVYARKLSEAALMLRGPDDMLSIAAIVDPNDEPDRERIDRRTLGALDRGEPIIVRFDRARVEAVTPIDRSGGLYLYTARETMVPALANYERAQSVVSSYRELFVRAAELQRQFNLLLFGLSLLLVGLAIWFALRFADRQVRPLTELVTAARAVGAGNFALRVEGRTGMDEIGLLNRAFNRMTAQIERQTTALVGANRQLDERRAFTEAVLESVTAGIVSTDRAGHVRLMNSSALGMFPARSAPVGQPLAVVAPELAAFIGTGSLSGIVQYNRDGELRTLAAKAAATADGAVLTFEDITRQLLDQRQAAWSDVARRIAHEIKNPLTPIQLATERLKRRYRRQIEQDGELFDELTSTIVRQVGQLRTMVDEFSRFARLPKPVFREEDPVDLVRQALFLQEVGRADIDFAFEDAIGEPFEISCDRHQFGQAMTNVLKNAGEAIEARIAREDRDYRGRIRVRVSQDAGDFCVTVRDNGIGLPADRDRLVEPYVTTREKGTGLGLAIVNKIVEEHGGDMAFAANPGGGTAVTMRFARYPIETTREAAQ